MTQLILSSAISWTWDGYLIFFIAWKKCISAGIVLSKIGKDLTLAWGHSMASWTAQFFFKNASQLARLNVHIKTLDGKSGSNNVLNGASCMNIALSPRSKGIIQLRLNWFFCIKQGPLRLIRATVFFFVLDFFEAGNSDKTGWTMSVKKSNRKELWWITARQWCLKESKIVTA